MNLEDLPDLLRPSEVAEHLRVSVGTVGRWVRAGKLRTTRTLGGHHRISKASLLAMLNEPEPHKPYQHKGFGSACGVCSPAAGEPVAWASCRATSSTPSGSAFPDAAAAPARRGPATSETR